MSIPPNPRRVGYIVPIHGLTYTPTIAIPTGLKGSYNFSNYIF